MGKSVKIIGKEKWISLSSRQKHTALAKFAIYCIETKNPEEFYYHYNKLISWSPIDRFFPPKWIKKLEALELFFSFHQKLSDKPIHYFREQQDELTKLVWNPKIKSTIVLDQVLAPYNVGSIIRIMDNFSFSDLIHSTKGLDVSNPNLKRSAMGAEQWIPIKYEPDLLSYLNNKNIPSIALEKTNNSVPLTEWTPPDTEFNILIGNEAYGISENLLNSCSESVHITMEGYKNSMNLSHAFAILSFYISNYYRKK